MTVDPYDHVRAGPDDAVPAGVYRVVGVGERVTLLRVADGRGRRVHSGVIECVENPDAGGSLAGLVDRFDAYGTALRHWLGI